MVPKVLSDIVESDILSLIANSVAEGKTIEYKQTLPGGTDADKKEFLADISSFANTSGGDLIFGVSEKDGMPIELAGIKPTDMDLELRRLDSIIADGLEPRIRYGTKVIDCSNGIKVVVIRAERSWSGPHRVIFKALPGF